MNNNGTLFDGMILFCSVVENKGFSTAARELGHTPSHVSKQIARLEQRLGARLLNRTTRSVSLTDMGLRYFEQARQIIEDARIAQDLIHDGSSRPSGILKISAPVSLSQSCLNSWLPEFLLSYPDIRLNIETSDRMVDLVSEGFDVVVRAGNLKDSNMIAKRLFTSRLMTVASPRYLDRNGVPKKPEDIREHVLISFSRQKITNAWSFIDSKGKQLTVQITPHVICNSAETEEALAIAGVGITRLPSFACQKAIADKLLIAILEDYEKPPIGIYAIYPSRSNLAQKVRVFVDFLDQKFGMIHSEQSPS